MSDLPPAGMTPPAAETEPVIAADALDRSTSDWYLILIVAALTLASGAAVFYLVAIATGVDASAIEWFKGIGLTGFGALLGLLTQKAISINKEN